MLTGQVESEVLLQHAGSLLEMPSTHAVHYAEVGRANHFAIHALCQQLWEHLEPHLGGFPLRYWALREGQSHIDILLDPLVPLRLWPSASQPPQVGLRYSIELAELLPDGGYRSAPWKPAALKLVYSELEKAWNAAKAAAEASAAIA